MHNIKLNNMPNIQLNIQLNNMLNIQLNIQLNNMLHIQLNNMLNIQLNNILNIKQCVSPERSDVGIPVHFADWLDTGIPRDDITPVDPAARNNHRTQQRYLTARVTIFPFGEDPAKEVRGQELVRDEKFSQNPAKNTSSAAYNPTWRTRRKHCGIRYSETNVPIMSVVPAEFLGHVVCRRCSEARLKEKKITKHGPTSRPSFSFTAHPFERPLLKISSLDVQLSCGTKVSRQRRQKHNQKPPSCSNEQQTSY